MKRIFTVTLALFALGAGGPNAAHAATLGHEVATEVVEVTGTAGGGGGCCGCVCAP